MPEPIVITIEHHGTKDEIRARIGRRLDRIRAEVAPYVSALRTDWRGDALDFELAALGQAVTGTIAVEEKVVRISVALPGLLGVLGGRIAAAVRDRAPKLIAP